KDDDFLKLNNNNNNYNNNNNNLKDENNHGIELEDAFENADDSSNNNDNDSFNLNNANYDINNSLKDNIQNNSDIKSPLNIDYDENFESSQETDSSEARIINKENHEFPEKNDNSEPATINKENFEISDDINSYDLENSEDNHFSDELNSDIEKNSNNPESFEEKIHLVNESISEIKSEMKNINESIHEIENKKAPKNIFIINKSKEDKIANENDLDTKNLNIGNEDYNNIFKDNSVNDEELENIIQSINAKYNDNKDFLQLESNNTSKERNLKDFIVPYTVATEIPLKNPEELYNNSINSLSSIVDEIVFIEGPIHVNEVIVRIRESCNIKRTGSKIKKIISQAIAASEHNGSIINIEDFLFLNNWSKIPIRKRKKPNIDLIANEEIEENISLVINYKGSINQNELVKSVAKNFGFKSISQKTSTKIGSIIEYMIINGDIVNYDGKIKFFKK
ncbi:MAG: DUF3320 domain-containing protein, partial [Methanobrevibacter sp.]|nr:DUF3320 domain-containing protein [Methanobrevibacter sp.]